MPVCSICGKTFQCNLLNERGIQKNLQFCSQACANEDWNKKNSPFLKVPALAMFEIYKALDITSSHNLEETARRFKPEMHSYYQVQRDTITKKLKLRKEPIIVRALNIPEGTQVKDIKITPDNNYLVVAEFINYHNCLLSIYDTKTFQRIRVLGNFDSNFTYKISSDSKKILTITGSRHPEAKFFNIENGECEKTLNIIGASYITHADFAIDSNMKFFVTSDDNASMKAFNFDGGIIRDLDTMQHLLDNNWHSSLGIKKKIDLSSPNNNLNTRYMATLTFMSQSLHIWEISANPLTFSYIRHINDLGTILNFGFVGKNKLFAFTSDDNLYIWDDIETDNPYKINISGLSVSPSKGPPIDEKGIIPIANGNYFIYFVYENSKTIKFLIIGKPYAESKLLNQGNLNFNGDLLDVAISQDEKYIIVADSKVLTIFDLFTGTELYHHKALKPKHLGPIVTSRHNDFFISGRLVFS